MLGWLYLLPSVEQALLLWANIENVLYFQPQGLNFGQPWKILNGSRLLPVYSANLDPHRCTAPLHFQSNSGQSGISDARIVFQVAMKEAIPPTPKKRKKKLIRGPLRFTLQRQRPTGSRRMCLTWGRGGKQISRYYVQARPSLRLKAQFKNGPCLIAFTAMVETLVLS